MHKRIQIGLVGDFDQKMYTHVALNNAIEHCRRHVSFTIEAPWISTDQLDKAFFLPRNYDGFLIAPGSPYQNDNGVFDFIGLCREKNFRLLGMCGGFQYMVLEYAKNVLKLSNAAHQETDPETNEPVIHKMSCSLKGQQEEVTIKDKQSWLYNVLEKESISGKFNCSYGVNPAYQNSINQFPFVFTAFSATGEARAFELKGHKFFAGTLFQPALDSTEKEPNPLLLSFFNQCAKPESL